MFVDVLSDDIIERCIGNSANVTKDLFHECSQYVYLLKTK